MPALRSQYLAALGVTDWRQRRPLVVEGVAPEVEAAVAVPEPESAGAPAESLALAAPAIEPAALAPAVPGAGVDTWELLEGEVAGCIRCPLHKSRTRTVFGVGNRQARWLIVGEAPGAEEDRQGEPFVGPAGKLLDSMLRAIGLSREEVFIANILKCRPPENRNPVPLEVTQCLPYLERQIALLKPAILLAVGGVAAQNLLGTDAPVGRLRGQLHHFGAAQVPLVVTYHPAYLLRSPGEKRKAWEDLKFARRIAGAAAA